VSFFSLCEQAARRGGEVLQRLFGKVTASEKGPADLVTEADIAAQKAVCDFLSDAFPEALLLGEEGADAVSPCPDGAYRWVIDPLDGTTNYAHGVPHYAVSVALQHGRTMLAGAVFNPAGGECFTAEAGKGAFLDGRSIRCSSVTEVSAALAALGFPPGVTREDPDVGAFLNTLLRCQAIRRTGSAALNLCYVACGRFDTAWSYGTKIWDHAAGGLIVREAGGVITMPDGSELIPEKGCFLASANPTLHQAMVELVGGNVEGKE
jgi:myo-inositol-1(or 4)-monophosphatase